MTRYPPTTKLVASAASAQAMPAYRVPIVDPVTGATVVRISDKTAFGTATNALRHAYSKVQPWSRLGKKLVLNYTSPHAVLDGNTYAILNAAASLPSSFRWSNVADKTAYGVVSGNQLVRVDMTDNTGGSRTTLKTFTGYTQMSIGEGEGNISADDRYFPMVGTTDAGVTYNLFVYDLTGDAILGTPLNNASYDWISLSPSGAYAVVNWAAEGSGAKQGTKVYDKSMTLVRHLTNGIEHGDIGTDAQGNEVYVCVNYLDAGAGIESFILATGVRTVIIAKPPDFYAGHVSCRNTQLPGWAYVSSYGSDTSMPGIDLAFAVKLDGSGRVRRFAHEHHTQPAAGDYQAQGVPNRDGSRVLFASEWGAGFTATPSYAFVATMPDRGRAIREPIRAPTRRPIRR